MYAKVEPKYFKSSIYDMLHFFHKEIDQKLKVLFSTSFITCQQKQFMAKENCIEKEIFKCKKYECVPCRF